MTHKQLKPSSGGTIIGNAGSDIRQIGGTMPSGDRGDGFKQQGGNQVSQDRIEPAKETSYLQTIGGSVAQVDSIGGTMPSGDRGDHRGSRMQASHAEVMARAADPEFLREVLGDRFDSWEEHNGLDQAIAWGSSHVGWFADNALNGADTTIDSASGFLHANLSIREMILGGRTNTATDFDDPEVLASIYGAEFEVIANEQGPNAAVEWAKGQLAQETAQSEDEGTWGQARLTTMDQVYTPEGELKVDIPANGVLYIGYGPEDKQFLDLQAESDLLSNGSDNVVSLFNPSDEVLKALLADSGVQQIVIGGHGEGGDIFTVDEAGKARRRSGEEFANLFEGTDVKNVFLNICEGGSTGKSVAAALEARGMGVLAWAESVQDSAAIEAARVLIELAKDAEGGAGLEELRELAVTFDGPRGSLIFHALSDQTAQA